MTEEVVNILTKEKNIYRKSWKESFYCYSELGTHQKVLGKVIIPSNFFPPNRTLFFLRGKKKKKSNITGETILLIKIESVQLHLIH